MSDSFLINRPDMQIDDPYKRQFAAAEGIKGRESKLRERNKLLRDLGFAASVTGQVVGGYLFLRELRDTFLYPETNDPNMVFGFVGSAALVALGVSSERMLKRHELELPSKSEHNPTFPEAGTERYEALQAALPRIKVPEGVTLAEFFDATRGEMSELERSWIAEDRILNRLRRYDSGSQGSGDEREALYTLLQLADGVISERRKIDEIEEDVYGYDEDDPAQESFSARLSEEARVFSETEKTIARVDTQFLNEYCDKLDKWLPLDPEGGFAGWQHYAAVVARREQVREFIADEAWNPMQRPEAA